MISYENAIDCILSENLKLSSTMMRCANSRMRVLADDIFAPMDLPPFDNSAVDGFAINSKSQMRIKNYPLQSSIRAEGQRQTKLLDDNAVKIMTGAPMPVGADAVVMKEDAEFLHDTVQFKKTVLSSENVRRAGEDLKKGSLVAKKGMRITPALIGVFSALGIVDIPVFKPPKIRIISTGDELVKPGDSLQFGQVYYLMGPMLKAQCEAVGIDDVEYRVVLDDKTAITNAIATAIEESDIVLITGGMSKGDYDLVRPVLEELSVREIFYQGAWRPGKPLYFGETAKKYIFGLPGNPVAAFVCFLVFVKALLQNAWHEPASKLKSAVALNDFVKNVGITFFARAYVNENNQLSILSGQGSHQIFSLSRANALAVIPEAIGIVKAREVIHYLPF